MKEVVVVSCNRLIPLPIMLASLLSMLACGEGQPLDEFEAFSRSIQDLSTQAALDTLYALVDASEPIAGFARYHLGNLFYSQAGERAQTRGWNDSEVAAHLDSAEVWFNAAIASDSTMVRAYVNLGSLWDDRAEMRVPREERDERVQKARALFERALELDPRSEKARCNLGTLYKRQRDYEAAMQQYLAVLEDNPRSALAHYNLAILFATQNMYGEARRDFELAVKYDPHGDIGQRSRDNIKIIDDLQAAEASRARRP